MKKEQIIKNNKLIAEFLGTSKKVIINYNKDPEIWNCNVKYHISWDWIMPVVEKIDCLGASVIIGRMFCDIKYIDPLNEKKHFEIRIASGVKINAVNGAVVEFIKWYNKQK